jgi:hypothetical protein
MHLPGFTAEASLYKTKRQYQQLPQPAGLNGGRGILPALPVPVDEPGGGGGEQYGCGPCINGWQQCTWPNASYSQACTSCEDCLTTFEINDDGQLQPTLSQTCHTGNTEFTQPCWQCFEMAMPWPVPDQTLCITSLSPFEIIVL